MAKMLTVRLDDGEHAALAALAKGRGLSMAALVKGLLDAPVITPLVAVDPGTEVKFGNGFSGKSWKSAEAFVAKTAAPERDPHEQCRKAERASWLREQDARADYAAMLGILRTIATAKEQAPGSRRYLVYEDTMSAILAITDDVHERERQAAEFAVDMSEPF